MTDNQSTSALDFDAFTPVPVKLGGRSFMIAPQSAKAIQIVLEYASVDEERPIGVTQEGESKDPRQFVRDAFGNWDDTVAAVARMLGFEPGNEEYDSAYKHLDKHLSPRHVMGIYERWWEVNEVDAFFERAGRVLLTPENLRRRKLFLAQMLDRMTHDPETDGETPEEVEPTPA